MHPAVKTAIDIYKYLPKTNCGECGLPSCFGFAAKLAANLSSIEDCPHLEDQAREKLREAVGDRTSSPGTVYEQALEVLKEKMKTVDLVKTAERLGGVLHGPDSMDLIFLNERYLVTKERVLDASGQETRPWISILIYNHLCMPDPPPNAEEWTSFSAIPQSHAKDKAWKGHVEEVIAGRYSGDVERLRRTCAAQGGEAIEREGSHNAAYLFRFFPKFPVLLLFWDAVPEEDFPAQCTMLLDENANRYLDIESIVVLGEEFASRLLA